MDTPKEFNPSDSGPHRPVAEYPNALALRKAIRALITRVQGWKQQPCVTSKASDVAD